MLLIFACGPSDKNKQNHILEVLTMQQIMLRTIFFTEEQTVFVATYLFRALLPAISPIIDDSVKGKYKIFGHSVPRNG